MNGFIVWHHLFDGKVNNFSLERFEGSEEFFLEKTKSIAGANENLSEKENKVIVFHGFIKI